MKNEQAYIKTIVELTQALAQEKLEKNIAIERLTAENQELHRQLEEATAPEHEVVIEEGE